MLAAALVLVSLLPAPSGDPQEQVRKIAEREGLQTSLTFNPRESASRPAEGRTPAPPPRRTPEAGSDRGSGGGPNFEERASPSAPGGTGWAKALIFLVGAGLLVALIVGLVAALRRPVAPAATRVDTDPAPMNGDTLPQAALGPAEALAAEGRHAEAVHRLLLDALSLLAARSPHGLASVSFAPHRTSREVLAALRLGPAADAALRALVDAVEISRFGGRPLGEADWHRAHAAFAGLSRAAHRNDAAGAP